MFIHPYFTGRWASLPNPDEFIQPSLSPTGSAMLQAVAIGLLWLKDSLASTLFTEAWQKLAAQVNEVWIRHLTVFLSIAVNLKCLLLSFSLKSWSCNGNLMTVVPLNYVSIFSIT